MEENKLFNENSFKVVGRLVSADVKVGNRQENGAGYVSVDALVASVIDGEDNEYPITFFANEQTKDGKHSKLYDTYAKLGELIGKKIEVTGSIRENRFFSESANQLVSSQQLSGMWVKGVVETTADTGTFSLGGFLGRAVQERKNKNDEIYRYDMVIGQSNYKGDNMAMFTVHLNPANVEVVNGVQSLYQVGDTFKVEGSLKFTVKEETVQEETGFGKPITKTYKNKQKNFYVTSGSNVIYDEGKAYDVDIIKSLKAAYDAKDVELMSAKKEVAKTTAAPAPVSAAPQVTKRQASLI